MNALHPGLQRPLRCAGRTAAVACGLAAAMGVLQARSAPVAGMTYTYDLSAADIDPGGFPVTIRAYADADNTAKDTVDAANPAAITSGGRLTDGNLGSLTVSDATAGCCAFNNGTYAGFRGDPGIGQAPKPKIDVNLHGTYALNSLTLHYLVEDGPSIYSPRPVPDQPGEPTFNALSVSGSTDGVNFAPLGFSNETTPVFGLDGDFGSGAREVRTLTIPLDGATATHLSIDVRSPWNYVFLSEFVVDAVGSGPGADFDGDSDVDGADLLLWQRGLGTISGATRGQGDADGNGAVNAADLAAWEGQFGAGGVASAARSAPEPPAAWLAAIAASFGKATRLRRDGRSGSREASNAKD